MLATQQNVPNWNICNYEEAPTVNVNNDTIQFQQDVVITTHEMPYK